MKALSAFSMALTFMVLSSSAQPRFCIGGALDDLTVSQVQACQQKSDVLRQEAVQQGAPADWHFVTVCDESGWEALSGLSGTQTEEMKQGDHTTDQRLHVTLVRGSHLEVGNVHQVDTLLAAIRDSMPQVTWRAVRTTPARPLPSLSARVQMPAMR